MKMCRLFTIVFFFMGMNLAHVGCGKSEDSAQTAQQTAESLAVRDTGGTLQTGADEREQQSGRDSVVIIMTGGDSLSVFDILRQSHKIEHRATSTGVFVTAIDDVHKTDNADWIYTVNNSMIPVAADKYIVDAQDTIRWILKIRE